MKITYFDARGRVEPARLMLEMAGADYTFEGLPVEAWHSEGKPWALGCSPLGQLPVLEDGAFTLCQSQAIFRYVARKLGMYGDTVEVAARIDEVTETAAQLLQDFAKLFWEPGFADMRAEHRTATAEALVRLDAYLSRVGASDDHWIAADRYTLADAAMFYTLETVMTAHPGLLEEHPRLHRGMVAFFSADGVRQYVRGDRRPRSWTVPMAPFAGTPEETFQWRDGDGDGGAPG